jgi:hypothetical protein
MADGEFSISQFPQDRQFIDRTTRSFAVTGVLSPRRFGHSQEGLAQAWLYGDWHYSSVFC